MNPYTRAEQLAEKAIREARKRRVEFSIQEAYVQAFRELHGESPEVHLCSGKKFFQEWNQAKRSAAREYHKRRDSQRELYRSTHPKLADIWPEVQHA